MPTYPLKGKVAIVTGAGSGIGYALTELLLSAECSVVLADLKLGQEAERTLAEHPHPVSTPGLPTAIFLETDVSNWAHLTALWDNTIKEFGRVDIVACVAGIYEPPSSNFWRPPGISPESLDLADASIGQYMTFAVNQVAPIRLAQIALDYWTQNRDIQGNYLAVGSMASYLHSIETPLYMASKAALVSFVKSLGAVRDLFGIRIAALCPGPVYTPIFEPEWNRKLTPDDISLTPKECAAIILRVMQEPQWGNGSIVEAQKIGNKEASEIVLRDLQMELLYPKSFTKPSDGVIRSREALVGQLQNHGMRF